jgi:hypothetical protein
LVIQRLSLKHVTQLPLLDATSKSFTDSQPKNQNNAPP